MDAEVNFRGHPGFFLELGCRAGVYSRLHEDQNREDQMSTVRHGLFVRVSLLVRFTMALARSLYAEHHAMLVDEAVSIGATYQRAMERLKADVSVEPTH